MKERSICSVPKDIEDFYRNKARSDGRSSFCKQCNKIRSADYYRSHRAHLKTLIVASNKKNISRNENTLYEYLATHPCVDCGEKDVLVLDFDHVRGTKKNHVTVMSERGTSPSVLQEEIEKCDIRCSNCHRRKTHQSSNSRRYRWVSNRKTE